MSEKIEKNNIEDIIELTSTQKGILFHYVSDSDSKEYHEQLSLSIIGDVKLDLLQKAWDFVIDSNEMLRTVFRWNGIGKPIQIVQKNCHVSIQYLDAKDVDNKEAVLREVKSEDLKNKIDITKETLRLYLVKLEDLKYEMIISNHHILYDGWSNGVIIHELMEACTSLYKNKKLVTKKKSRFSEFVKLQRSIDKEKHKNYWSNYFEGLNTKNDYFYSNKEKMLLKEFSYELSDDMTNNIRNFAKRNKISLSSILYSAWGILIQKISNLDSIIVGTTVAGRPESIDNIDNVVGLFINTIPLIIKSQDNSTIKDIINQVDRDLLERKNFENTPLMDIREYCGITESDSIFDSIVAIENYPMNFKANDENILKIYDFSIFEKSNYNMSLGIYSFHNIKFKFTYNSLIVDEEMVNKFGVYLKKIIENILSNANKLISEIDLVTKEEKNKLLYEFNNTRVDYPKDKTMQQIFEAQVNKTPNNIAIAYKGITLTYKELNKRVNSLAYTLREKGTRPNSIVAIMGERSIEMLVGIIAIIKSGAAYLPIHPDYPQERINFIIKDSSAKILITFNKYKNKASFNGEILEFEDEKIYSNNVQNLEIQNKSDDLAYILYTSGSTGIAKGVMIRHRSVLNTLNWLIKRYKIHSGINFLNSTEYIFDPSILQIFGTLFSGSTVFIIEKDDLIDKEKFKNFIIKNKIHIVNLIPSMAEQLLTEYKLEPLNIVIVGGERLKNSTKDRLIDLGYNLNNHYGLTEVTIDSLAGCCEKNEKVTLGKPIDNTKIYILNKNKKLVPIGVYGEIYIAGDGIAKGYLNREELNSERFIENPYIPCEVIYKTGDIGRILPDGKVEFLGRIDEQVKIRGFRIELGEIENKILNSNLVKEVCVIDRMESDGNKYLCAYYTCDGEEVRNQIIEYLTDILPQYMIPSYFVRLDSMPHNSNGKLDRKRLPEPDKRSFIQAEYQEVTNDIEERVANIYKEILGSDKVGINDDFFYMGGHSLKAMELVEKIHKQLNIIVPITELFKLRTVKKLSEYISGAKNSEYRKIELAEEKEYYEVSSAQKRVFTVQQFDNNTIAYNMPGAIELKGNIDKDKIDEVLNKIIERHEILRTSFEIVDGKIIQRIKEKVGFKLQYMENDKDIETLFKEFVTPFNLRESPLLKACLIKTQNEKYVLMFDIHHIISDGTSIAILANEFFELYSENSLEQLPIQYKDYSEWQNNLLSSTEITKQRAYWVNKFSGELPILNLPYDYTRTDLQSFQGEIIEFNINKEYTKKLINLSVGTESTLYMVLLAAYNIVLSKYTGQEDIIIGTPTSGRYQEELHKMIGMFVNTLPMRNYPKGEKRFINFLEEVRKNSLKAFENQDYQFEALVDELGGDRDLSRNPVFDTMFILQNTKEVKMESDDLQMRLLNYNNNISKFDLLLEAFEVDDEIKFKMQYCIKLFKKETVERIICAFKKVLETIVEDSNILISQIKVIDEKKIEEINLINNYTKIEYSKDETIQQLFQKQVKKTPNDIAVVFKDKKLTYEELDFKSNDLANYLIYDCKIEGNSSIGIIMKRSENMIVAILGILKAGAAYVPIDSKLPRERIKDIIQNAEISIVVSDETQVSTLNKLQWECEKFDRYICIDSDSIYEPEKAEENKLMDKKVWKYIVQSAENEISEGGWISSYTGKPFSKKDMQEYSDNIFAKVKPFLNRKIKVLEIGCASGISMFKIAPFVELYYGTDLSETVIENNKRRVIEKGITNIKLDCLQAHEISTLKEVKFDMIIINSVIQYFPGYNYFKKVIDDSIKLLNNEGVIFIGDIMDLDQKNNLIQSLREFKENNSHYKHITKTDFQSELFVARRFFNDLEVEKNEIENVNFSNKICTIENELTRFRYDCILKVNKLNKKSDLKYKFKEQHSLKNMEKYKSMHYELIGKSNDLAYVIFTSGSTGIPKGVMIEHRALNNYIIGMTNSIKFSDLKSIVALTTISFDIFVTETILPLVKGMKIIIADEDEQKDLELFGNLIKSNEVEILQTTPSRMQLIVNNANWKEKFKSLRLILIGGEVFPQQLLNKLFELDNITVYNMYGPTETTVWSLVSRLYKDSTINIGKPIANTQIFVLDKYLNPVDIGVSGELYIAGDGLARGYLNDKKLTSERFVSNPFVNGQKMYSTGDIVKITECRNIHYLGRSDYQVKIRGFRIELEEIENKIRDCTGVVDTVVIDKTDRFMNKYLCAYIASEEDINIDEIKKYLFNKLPEYMIPTEFVEMKSLKYTASGKVDRKELKKINGIVGKYKDYEVPSNRNEELMMSLWKEVLESNSFGINDNFFELGGHSLRAINLISKIQKIFNVDILVKDFFANSTIKTLVKYIESCKKSIYSNIERVGEQQYYKASSSQKRIYIIQQQDTKSTAYNMPSAMEIHGELSITYVEEVFNKIIQRHEILRTSFEIIEGEVIQKVNEKLDFKVGFIHSNCNEDFKEITKKLIKPFDLEKDVLLRVTIIKLSKDRHILFIDIHHLIFDGISINVLMNDFAEIYEKHNLPELKIQYKDYSQWQNNLLERDEIKEQMKYWNNILGGDLPILDLPYDYKRLTIQSFEGETIELNLNERNTRKLREICKENNTTMYMLLLAIYNVWLHKYSYQDDIIVGTAVSGRYHDDLKNLIGMFVNTLPIRNFPTGDKTFRQFLSEVKERILDAFENRDIQFEELVDSLNLPRDISMNPVFNAVFAFNESYIKDIDIDNIHVTQYNIKNEISKFDIELFALENDETITLLFNYCRNLFKQKTMQRMIDNFNNLIEIIVQNIDCKLNDIDIISGKEKEKLLSNYGCNEKSITINKTVCDLFEENVSKYANKVVVKCRDEKITYGNLDKRVNRLARVLRKKGVRQDKIVCILCERSIDMVVAILATFKAGGAYIPIDTMYPIDRIKTIISDSKAEILLTASNMYPNIDELYTTIGLNTDVNFIINMDELNDINKYNKLFRTLKLSKRISKEKDLFVNEDALVYKDEYIEYNKYRCKIEKIIKFIKKLELRTDSAIALLIDNPIEKIIVISSLNYLDQKYYFIDNVDSIEDTIKMLNNVNTEAIIAESKFINIIDNILFKSEKLEIGIIINDISFKDDRKEIENKPIWDFMSLNSIDQINGYGWVNSYNGEKFSETEMIEYIDNFRTKLSNHINTNSKILEIGCGHGLMVFELYNMVEEYVATDLSDVIIEKNKQRAKDKKIKNVKFKTLAASNIEQVEENNFDVVACTSVVHYFPNTLYLENVIENSIGLLKGEGIIYLDDLMDLDKKEEFWQSILDYKEINPNAKSKLNFDSDLFVDKQFFSSLKSKYEEIEYIEISNKLGKVPNELTKYRYDVLIKINKKHIKITENPMRRKIIYSYKNIESNVKDRSDELDLKKIFNYKVSNNYCLESIIDLNKIKAYSEEKIGLINDLWNLSYIIYTSGSTGKPKGAMVEHIGMMNHMMCKIKDLKLTNESIIVQNASQCFDISVWQFLCALVVGGCTTIYTNDVIQDVDKFITKLIEDNVTILEVVPSFLSVLLDRLEEREIELKNLKYLVVTGETINKKLTDKWFENYPDIKMVNAYGPTEASDDITHYIMDKAPTYENVPIGKPLYNFNIYIVDKNMKLCPIGVKGELVVSGIGVGRGYLNDKEKTEKSFIKDPFVKNEDRRLYKTGDIARWMEDGNIEFFNRKDHQVKIRGFRIELGEIESNLLKIDSIKEAVVLDKEDVNGAKYLCAYIVSNNQIDKENLKKELNKKLPSYMIPDCYIEIEKMPTNANGKIDKKALANIESNLIPKVDYAPTNDIEKKLVDIWKELLNVAYIGENDSFFDLGGHSLKITKLIYEIGKKFSIDLKFKDIFEKPFIKDISNLIAVAQRDKFLKVDPSVEKDYYLLSSAQKRLYMMQQLLPESTVYNISFALEINGELDVEKVCKIIEMLKERHESLRTSFEVVEEQIVQKVNINTKTNISKFLVKKEEIDYAIKEFIKPFNLNDKSLFRVGLFEITKNNFVLLFDIHHIISDGKSIDILTKEFIKLYQEQKLENLKIQYKDYSEWQNKMLDSEFIKKQKQYWINKFSDKIPLLNMPCDFNRNKVLNFNGSSIEININNENEFLTKIRELCNRNNVSTFMLLFSIYNVLLLKYTGQEDIVIGVPTEGRDILEEDNIIGMFVNTIPMRNKPQKNKIFIDFLKEIKENVLLDYENQYFQFEELVDKLKIKRELNRNPMFDTMFSFQNSRDMEIQIDGLEFNLCKFNSNTAKFDITLIADESKDNIKFIFEYSTNLYKEETINMFAKDYVNILFKVVQTPDIRINDIEIEFDSYINYKEQYDTENIDFKF